MKALITSGMLLFLWIGGYYIWDHYQFHWVAPATPPSKSLSSQEIWTDFFESYSFEIMSSSVCSEACCVRLHVLQWKLEHPHPIATDFCTST